MSTAWLKNFVGLKQSDYEMLKVPRPRVEYGIHMTVRAMQAGALVGSIFGPLMVIYRGGKLVERNGDISNLKDAVADGGSCGAIIGAMLGPVLTYFALRNMNSIRVYDHCYRLRFNSEQLIKDRTCLLGAGIGYLSSGTLGFVVGVDLAYVASKILSSVWK